MIGQRLLICGSRDWRDRDLIRKILEQRQPSVVIEGEAKGADTIAREIAEEMGIEVLKFPAQWQDHAKGWCPGPRCKKEYCIAAGGRRNHQMLQEGAPDMVIAFHPFISKSKGTKDCVYRARNVFNLPVLIITGRPVEAELPL